MSLPKSSDIPQTLHAYIDKLKHNQDGAKLVLDKNTSLYERASSAYTKAKLTEDTLKIYYVKLVQTNNYALGLIEELEGTLNAFCRIKANTLSVANETKKLTIETGEVLAVAEELKKQLMEFRKCVEKSPKLVACVDVVLKTLTPNGTIEELVASFQNAIIALKKAMLLHHHIAGECGLHSRINETRQNIKNCCLPLEFKEDKPLEDNCEKPSDKLCDADPCPDINEDDICKSEENTKNGDCEDCCCYYNKYKGAGIIVSNCITFDIQRYANQLEQAYDQIMSIRKRAYDWMKCVTDAKDEAETRYTSCKAAYEAALLAKKCN